jgi:N-acetylmuramoyl-L-alanine amidase
MERLPFLSRSERRRFFAERKDESGRLLPNLLHSNKKGVMKNALLFSAPLVPSLAQAGDSIVACGEKFSIRAPVVLWSDPGGFDAYKVDPSLPKMTTDGKPRGKGYDVRKSLDEKARLDALREVVDQFVLHYDVCGVSKTCFKVLKDRGLSVHFMLDLDGTIYQSLDLRERAWHATIANGRSIGVEIANIGSYRVDAATDPLSDWYKKDPDGKTRITIPKRFGEQKWRLPDFVPRPRRPNPIIGEVQGRRHRMYDLTAEQYDSLIKLTAGLTKVFPKIRCDYPRDEKGNLVPHKLPDDQLARYTGVLGHFHVQTNKTDPGPALDWDYIINEANKLRHKESK